MLGEAGCREMGRSGEREMLRSVGEMPRVGGLEA